MARSYRAIRPALILTLLLSAVILGPVMSAQALTQVSSGSAEAGARASALRQRGLPYVEIATRMVGEGFTTADIADGIGSVMGDEPQGFVVDVPPALARVLVGAELDPAEIARALRDRFAATTTGAGRALAAAGTSVEGLARAVDILVAGDSGVPAGARRSVTGRTLVGLGLDENDVIAELGRLYGLGDADSFALVAREWVAARSAHTGLIVKYGTRFQRPQQRELSSVDWYLESPEHSFQLCNDSGCTSFSGGLPALASLGQGGGTGNDWWLEPDLDARPDIVSGNLPSAKAYVHVLRRDTFTDLQHWLFYAASGPVRVRCLLIVEGTDFGCAEENLPFGGSTLISDEDEQTFEIFPVMGGHTGHWENVTLRFDNDTKQLIGAFMSEYGEYRPYELDQLTFNETGDVLTYAGLYSQANYALEPETMESANEHEVQRLSFIPGLKEVCLGWEISDHCLGLQMDFFSSTIELYLHNQIDTTFYRVFEPDWSASDNRELVAINGEPVPGAEWIAYPGRWGAEANYNTLGNPEETPFDRANFLMRDETRYYLLLMAAARVAVFDILCSVAEEIIPLPLCAGFDLYFQFREENFADWINDIIAHTNATASNASVSPGMQGKAWVYDECPKDGFTVSRGYGYGTELKSIDIDPSTWEERFSEDNVFEKIGCGGQVPRP